MSKLSRITASARTVTTLARAGVLPAMSLRKYVRAVRVARAYGLSPATTFATSAVRCPDRPAVIDERGSSTWAELDQRTDRLATELATMIQNADGPTVAVMARNSRPFVEAAIATAKLGGRVLLLNTGFSGPQLQEVVDREGADAIVFDDEFRSLVGDLGSSRPALVAWQEESADDLTVTELIDRSTANAPAPPRRASRIVILTSGTSGTPKGAERGGSGSGIGAISGFFDRIPLRANDTLVLAAPMFHAWGLAGLTLGSSTASTLVVQRRFDPEKTLALVAEYEATVLWLVPVMLERIMALPRDVRAAYDLSTLRIAALSGSAVQADAVSGFMDEVGDIVYNNYSSTEVGWAAIATPADLRAAPATAGRPPRGTELRILDENGGESATGTPGRIFVRNDSLFEGYTGGGRKGVVDGFMETGDVGHVDDEGRLFVDGRSDDMIVSGGENVYPAEVERLLDSHPGVVEAAVVGVPDAEFGQRLCAFVVPHAGTDAHGLPDELRAHVRDNLARHKVPRSVEVIGELPRNATGKVVKRDLIARAAGGAD